ncbi:MAG: sigma 54-interacting transcriptional regulator [Candidatus Zixiibacteriota bacterium]
MNQTSLQSIDFDNRLLETEELYRQLKPSIAHDLLGSVDPSGFKARDYEYGLYRFLVALDLYYQNQYNESIKVAQEANRLLATSAFHRRFGGLNLLLSQNYSSLGNLNFAERHAHDSLAFFRQADDNLGMIRALSALSNLSFIRSDFEKSIAFLNEAIDLAKGDNIRMAQLIGNLGRIEILSGDWKLAKEHLNTAIKLANELKRDRSVARNYLSLGYLYARMRKFDLANRQFKSAEILIDKGQMDREKLILMEYEGELAFDHGDIISSYKILSEARKILNKSFSPESSLGSQLLRRLAQVEFALDNLDESLKLAQKSLEIANNLGEKAEIGHSGIVIAMIFANRQNYDMAFSYLNDSIEILRKAGDPYDVARALVIEAEIFANSGKKSFGKIDKTYEEAFRLYNKLKLFYWAAEVRFRQGKFCCYNSNLSIGFKRLLESESIFEKIDERSKVRSVRLFKQELSKQAVAASISTENEFKIFGDYFSDTEYSNLKSGQMFEIINILGMKTNASRAIVFKNDTDSPNIITNSDLSSHQKKKFMRQINDLLGEEFANDQPTLILDSRRDPFINEIIPAKDGSMISSVIVVPLGMSGDINGYIYLDKIINNGTEYIPFGQKELNFAVGFSDLISLKLAEYEKMLLEEDNKRLKAQLLEEASFPNIITRNKQMLEMLSRVQQVVNSDISISITGETGCGKDLLAKAIHYNSDRRDKRFISVNCAALPETLLESELFGHKRGAFTGADRDKVGLFEEADNGTFFLDEIADMPLSIQAKVLRILEEQEVVRLGETRPIKVNVRIVSATNKDLKREMEAGTFRQDLYYRLTALCFAIPPLRERREDIPLLIKHFAEDSVKFTPEVMKKLVTFDWPGNIRELENEIKKLVLLAGENGVVEPGLLSAKITDIVKSDNSSGKIQTTNIDFDGDFSLYDYLAEYERRFIIKALQEQSGVKKHAAKMLNIPESTLRLKIKQYNIDSSDFSAVG